MNLNLKVYNDWTPINGLIKLNVREYNWIANCIWKTVLPRNWRIEETLQIGRISKQHDQELRTVCLLQNQVRTLQERLEFIEDSIIFQEPDSSSSFDSAHVSHQALLISSYIKLSRGSRMQRNTRGLMSILGTDFGCQPARRDLNDLHNNSNNLAASQGFLRREGIEKSVSEESLQSISLPCIQGRAGQRKSRRWKLSYVYDKLPCFGYWHLYSKRHDNAELSFLGDVSGKIPWPHGISELDFEVPNRSLLEGEESHARATVHQGNRNAKSLEALITPKSITGKDFTDCGEFDLTMAAAPKRCYESIRTFERRSVSKSREPKRTTDFSEGGELLLWSTYIFVQPDPMTKFKDYQDCSVLNWRTTTFRTLIYDDSKHYF